MNSVLLISGAHAVNRPEECVCCCPPELASVLPVSVVTASRAPRAAPQRPLDVSLTPGKVDVSVLLPGAGSSRNISLRTLLVVLDISKSMRSIQFSSLDSYFWGLGPHLWDLNGRESCPPPCLRSLQ